MWVAAQHERTEDDAEDLVEDTLVRLSAEAPLPLKQSLSAVLSWHRWNRLFVSYIEKGDLKGASECQKNIDALMRSVH